MKSAIIFDLLNLQVTLEAWRNTRAKRSKTQITSGRPQQLCSIIIPP